MAHGRQDRNRCAASFASAASLAVRNETSPVATGSVRLQQALEKRLVELSGVAFRGFEPDTACNTEC